MQEVMAKLELQRFFAVCVTAEDGTETIAESLLSAAFKLQRPPNQCVVFDSSPSGVAAAHNCTMKVLPCCHFELTDPHNRCTHFATSCCISKRP